MGAKLTLIAHENTARLAAAVFLGDVFQAASPTEQVLQNGYTAILGYVNSPQAGTLDVYQGTFADVIAIIAAVPAAATGNGAMRLDTFAHPAGAANVGTPVAIPLVGPFVRCRFTNGGVNQTSFRLNLAAVE